MEVNTDAEAYAKDHDDRGLQWLHNTPQLTLL